MGQINFIESTLKLARENRTRYINKHCTGLRLEDKFKIPTGMNIMETKLTGNRYCNFKEGYNHIYVCYRDGSCFKIGNNGEFIELDFGEIGIRVTNFCIGDNEIIFVGGNQIIINNILGEKKENIKVKYEIKDINYDKCTKGYYLATKKDFRYIKNGILEYGWGYQFENISIHEDGSIIAGFNSEKGLLFDPRMGIGISTLKESHLGIGICSTFQDRYYLVGGGHDSVLKRWDIRRMDQCEKMFFHKEGINCIENGNNRMIYSVGHDGSIAGWNVWNGELIYYDDKLQIQKLAIMRGYSNRDIITHHKDTYTKIWEIIYKDNPIINDL